MKESQLTRVRRMLKSNGEVTRNWALQNYITRLSAIILILKRQGYGIEAEKRGGDWVYKLKWTPNQ